MTALDELLKQQKELNEKIEELRKGEKKSALATIAELVSAYQITANEIAKVCGYQPVEVDLKKREKKVYGKATPKYQWTDSEGKVNFWSGRGSEMTRPKALVDFLNTKKITIDQFKNAPEYKYKG